MSYQPKALVLVSGGMDSLVTAAIAQAKHQELAFLHMNYGQKTEERELKAFKDIAGHFKVPKDFQKIVDTRFLQEIGGSSLTDKNIEVSKYVGDSNEIPSSYVPFRNTIIGSLGVSYAEVLGVKEIYIGAVEEDSSGYPDCRASYYQAFNELIKEGTKEGNIKFVTPLIELRKSQIILKAKELNAPLELSWSCYQSEDRACGVCDSCALRLRGFKEAGLTDPIPYAD